MKREKENRIFDKAEMGFNFLAGAVFLLIVSFTVFVLIALQQAIGTMGLVAVIVGAPLAILLIIVIGHYVNKWGEAKFG